eukprot:Awhi_evm1s1137
MFNNIFVNLSLFHIQNGTESLELWKEQAHIYVNTSETPLNKETMLRILDLHTALENTK